MPRRIALMALAQAIIKVIMHTQTLLSVTTLLSLLMGVVMMAAWRFNRNIPGLLAWTMSCGFGFLGSLAMMLRQSFPGTPVIASVQLFMLLTSWLAWSGARLYTGRPPPPWWATALTIASTLGLSVVLAQLTPSPSLRVALTSAVGGTLFLLAAHTIRKGELQRFPARYLFGLACAAHGVLVWARPVLLWLGQDLEGSASQGLLQFSILESMVFVILLALGAVLLVAEHIANELRLLSQRDELTEIFNRRSFLAVLDKAMSASQRSGAPLTILVIDLDHFKRINDRWGHLAGDRVLRQFTATAATCLRQEDVIGRMGGEEFAILVHQATPEQALEVAQRLRAAVEADTVACGDFTVNYTVSIGLAQYLADDSTESLLHRADQAMYRAKQAGRNRVEY